MRAFGRITLCMYCFKFYIYIGAMCVHVCVCAHTHVQASACVRVGRVCGCALRFVYFFLLCTFSPLILRKRTCYSVMFYTYVFTN